MSQLAWLRSFLLAIAMAIVGLSARAGEAAGIAGQTDPRFSAALALWLADDEAEALPAFAALAAEGNRAAQVLLTLIDTTPACQGPWLARLPRAERLRLMRAPGGLSGRRWMMVAAEDTPLARLWVERQATTTTPAVAMTLAAMGEARAARETLQALAARQFRGFAAVADDPHYPPDLRHLVWREWTAAGERARVEAEIAALMPGDPQIGRFEHRPVTPAERDSWLAVAPLAAPLRATCAALCPESLASCTRAAWTLIGYHALLAEFGTPSETLIPGEVWNASPRGRLTLLRLAPTRAGYADAVFARVASEDACLAAALDTETRRFPN